jgi:DNA-binding transcriptional ArsR family regulator
MNMVLPLQALANGQRLRVMAWLKDTTKPFPSQDDGDLVEDSVCRVPPADKLGVSQPTASEHLKILYRAGLILPKKKWSFLEAR